MVCVFAVFATLSMLFFKQFGVGLAAAILIDATIVRGVLLPATMKLLGERNWYLPTWLEWLPQLRPRRARDRRRAGARAGAEPAEAEARRRCARITGLVLDRHPGAGARVPEASPPAGNAVSVPAGAKAGQLTLHPCHYGTEQGSYAADCGTLVVPENRADPQLSADRPAGHPHQGSLGASGRTRLPPRGRSRHHEHEVLEGEPDRREPRRRPRRLPRRRRLRAARLPRSRVGAEALDRLSRPEVLPRVRRRLPRLRGAAPATDGVDLAGYSLPAQVDDLEAARTALGYGRIDLAQRERRHAHGADLRLALPEEHPPFGDDRRQPARPLPLGPADDRRQIRPLRALCAQDSACSQRTDDLAASMRQTAADIPDRCLGLPIKRAMSRLASFFGLMESTMDARRSPRR